MQAPIAANGRQPSLVFQCEKMSRSAMPRQRFMGRPCSTCAGPSHAAVVCDSALTQLRVMRLRFGLQAKTRASLSVHTGRLVYAALLLHLKAMWCHRIDDCKDGCRLAQACLFGFLLKPQADPIWPPSIRRWVSSTESSACVVWDEQNRLTRIAVGELFNFELTLIGEAAIQQIPAFVAAAMVAAEQGLGSGKQRLKARLAQVDVLNSVSERAQALMVDGEWLEKSIENLSLGYTDGLAWSAQAISSQSAPLTRLHLCFLSPMKLEARGRLVQEPSFQSLWSALVRRVRVLSRMYGAGDLSPAEYKPLSALAHQVQLERNETSWIRSTQHIAREAFLLEEGLTGQAWYNSPVDLRPLLPILWLGQWVHVGTGAAHGNGRYQVEVSP